MDFQKIPWQDNKRWYDVNNSLQNIHFFKHFSLEMRFKYAYLADIINN